MGTDNFLLLSAFKMSRFFIKLNYLLWFDFTFCFQVNLLETGIDAVKDQIVLLLEPMQNRMRRKNMKGAEILKKKLDELLPKKF